MPKHSRRYLELRRKVEGLPPLTVPEAVRKLKEFANTKFDQTVELAVRLGIDPRKSDQMVRGSVVLPHGTGRKVRVAVFAVGPKAREAVEAGADLVGAEDLAQKIQKGEIDFDACLATPDMMKIVGPLGRILGPRGLMPSPRTGTVTENVAETVRQFKLGRVEFKADAGGNVHLPVGKLSMPEEHLVENIEAALQTIRALRPAGLRGQYIRNITLSATMSPGIRVAAA
jgi:large subunit ribosomal protein L1